MKINIFIISAVLLATSTTLLPMNRNDKPKLKKQYLDLFNNGATPDIMSIPTKNIVNIEAALEAAYETNNAAFLVKYFNSIKMSTRCKFALHLGAHRQKPEIQTATFGLHQTAANKVIDDILRQCSASEAKHKSDADDSSSDQADDSSSDQLDPFNQDGSRRRRLQRLDGQR